MAKQKKTWDSIASRLAFKFPFKGRVTARRCDACGHHEIGIITEFGDYQMLRPGTKIIMLEVPEQNLLQSNEPMGKSKKGRDLSITETEVEPILLKTSNVRLPPGTQIPGQKQEPFYDLLLEWIDVTTLSKAELGHGVQFLLCGQS